MHIVLIYVTAMAAAFTDSPKSNFSQSAQLAKNHRTASVLINIYMHTIWRFTNALTLLDGTF